MEFAITKISSKGQIVIPTKLRNGIKKGTQFLVVKNSNKIILKRIDELEENMKNDFEFIKRIEIAWKKYEKGKFQTKNKTDFLKELEKW
jgi:AbrB family looped-hinge helix DNA binding protein